MLKEFPAKEAKALIGFEVGRMVLQRLPTVIPGGFVNSLANVYLATSAYIALQKATRPKPGLAGAPQWIRDILADHSRFSLKRLDGLPTVSILILCSAFLVLWFPDVACFQPWPF